MNAYKEIGIKKLIKYIVYSFWESIFNILIFSPLRVYWIRAFGGKVGTGTIIHQVKFHNLYHHGLKNIEIGKNCFLAQGISFDLYEKIILKDDVCIAENVIFNTHLNIGYKNHPLQKYFPSFQRPISLDQGVFIGVGSIILAGTKIGKYSFISAGSVVNDNIPAWMMYYHLESKKIIPIKK